MDKVVIIGGGPGGYAAALKLSGKGFDITVVEEESFGGVCLNVGCIPTKALLHHAKEYQTIFKSTGKTILIDGSVRPDWEAIQANKNSIVRQLVNGVEFLLKKSGVNLVKGKANIQKGNKVEVGGKILDYDKLIIATGSHSFVPPIKGAAESSFVINSTDALNFRQIPKTCVIIGGGVIGLEFASVLNAFGCKITIFEAMENIIPNFDSDVSKTLEAYLALEGVEIYTGASVQSIEDLADKAVVKALKGGKEIFCEVENVLISVGRRPNLEGYGLENLNIDITKKGILVNSFMQTSDPNIYAIGDVTGNMMLAHAAYAMAETAAKHISGEELPYEEAAIPSCVYTPLEVASVGLSEKAAAEKGMDVRVIKSPLSGNGMSLVETGGMGFVKVILGSKHKQVVGIQLVGKSASEIIAQGVQAIVSEQTAEEFLSFVYPHPSVSEALREAVLQAIDEAIHQVRN